MDETSSKKSFGSSESIPKSTSSNEQKKTNSPLSNGSARKGNEQGPEHKAIDMGNLDGFAGDSSQAETPAVRFTVCHIPEDDDNDYLYTVDSVQQTVTSYDRISVDTQDSTRYEGAPFPCGNIQFVQETQELELELESKKHYVVVPSDSPTEHVSNFIYKYWSMRSPKIILPIISAVTHFKPWKNHRIRDRFQKGIIKAANTTDMWIVTNGVDGGISKMVGEAIREEKATRASARVQMNKMNPSHVEKFKKLVAIGIVPKAGITYGDRFDGSEGITVQNEGSKPNSDLFELNPDHTHFLIVDEENPDRSAFTMLRCAMEKQLEEHIGRPRKMRKLFSLGGFEDFHDNITTDYSVKKTIPVVALLVQGSPRGIEHVLFYLRNKMPVLVLKGSGGIADIICHAYEEIQERCDPDFEENVLKLQLTKMIVKTYPSDFKDNDVARNTFRDKILECVHIALEEEDQTFLTIVNMLVDTNLIDLDKHILKAIFNAKKQARLKGQEQISKDLHLTIDWNRPDLASSEIFCKDDWTKIRVEKEIFEKALLKKGREEFVEMFLDHGMIIHKYLNHKKLKLLFERAEDREFFQTICLENALGKYVDPDKPLEQDFLATDLNRLIYKFTMIEDFIQPYELSMNSVGLYVLDPAVAERKALNCLIVWAVLMNRQKLAKVLWHRCDEPIPIALICSNMYRQMAKYCIELYLRKAMEANSNDFGKMALGVLEISFSDSSAHTYNMLSTPLPDFNNKTAIQIAHESNYMKFIAHPCCQKWLSKRLFGAIHVRELNWGIFRVPYWMKIITSALFIFPIFFWITFIPSEVKKTKGMTISESFAMEDEEFEESSDEDDEDTNIPASKSILELSKKKKKKRIGVRLKSVLKEKRFNFMLPVWKRVYLVWMAPITKFWLTQMMYFLYLAVFCLAVLWPTCGNLFLDLVVFFWTIIILTELVHHTFVKHRKCRAMSMWKNCLEIVVIIVFLILMLFLRVLPRALNYSKIHIGKTVLCFGLIYFFYRLLGLYLPISPTLGPMLVRMKRMIKKDFVTFIRMFLIFMISGGVTVQAILYPNFPLGVDLIRRVLTRPLFAMFLTQIGDLEGDPSCSHMYDNVTRRFCATKSNVIEQFSFKDSLLMPVEKCPYPSFAGYVVLIQYLLICKLIMVTLLFAMFSLTIHKVDTEADVIWKFQRYALITEFEDRPSLPPPFIVISYIRMFVSFIYHRIKGCKQKCGASCTCCKSCKSRESDKMVHKVQKMKRSESCSYWKNCAKTYITKQEEDRKVELEPRRQAETIKNIKEDLRVQKKNWKRMNDRMAELERMMQTSRLYLEDISHKLDNPDVRGVANVKGQIIHVAARQSPYPSTRIARFPVFDKYVPWELVYDVYDPKTYTKPKDQFSEDEISYVDEDMIEIMRLQEERKLREERKALEERSSLQEEDEEELPPLPTFSPVWNSVVTYKVGNITREVDRRSWMSHDDQPLRYELDPVGLPQNPKGRTGIRGKGVLWRWGPNHVIKVVCTRWRRKYNTDYQPIGFLFVEGKRVLEFIAVKKYGVDEIETVYGLPGDALHGLTTPYITLCESFMRSVMDDNEWETKTEFDQADMIQFFAQFSSSPYIPDPIAGSKTSLRGETDSQGFSAALIYKGYVDDPRNTDNAWVEAEVWNFHYDTEDLFDTKISEDSSVNWKECSPNVKIFANESAIVQEAARIHDAYH